MNMTVLYKKCTYGLLLIATTIINFCSAEIQCIDLELSETVPCPTLEYNTGDTEEIENIQRSAIYINNNQYTGNETINITIPEEIERDYYIGEDETDIEIIGYGYDQIKMQKMVNNQYYAPTSEEMANLVGKIADFLPLMAIVLLFIRVWWLIKKAF